jgi:hypothetical protein
MHLALASQTGVWMSNRSAPSGVPGHAITEISIGDAVDNLSNDEILAQIERLIAST